MHRTTRSWFLLLLGLGWAGLYPGASLLVKLSVADVPRVDRRRVDGDLIAFEASHTLRDQKGAEKHLSKPILITKKGLPAQVMFNVCSLGFGSGVADELNVLGWTVEITPISKTRHGWFALFEATHHYPPSARTRKRYVLIGDEPSYIRVFPAESRAGIEEFMRFKLLAHAPQR